jgi:threonine dehydrogenase-like Zn-dependent dehydrogenase
MAEVGLAHESHLLHVPDGVSSEDVSMLDPFACALHMVLLNEARDDETVLVYGCGVMGLCTIAALRVMGFAGRILAVEPSPFHAETAKQVGADEVIDPTVGKDQVYTVVAERTGGKLHRPILSKPLLIGGVDRVFDTVGTSGSVDTSLRILANRGTFNLLGIGEPKGMDWTPVWLKELAIQGIYGYGTETYEGRRVHTFALTLELLADGKLDLARFVTHRFTLDQWRQALQVCMHKATHRAIKVSFVSPR